MRRILLTIQYNGAGYRGWQRQKNGVSIQAVIEDALNKIVGHKTVIHGSGRTDTGVHAYGQTAHFDTESKLPLYKIIGGVNAFLPSDIRILNAEDVDGDFHARYSTRSKTYVYKMYVSEVDDVFLCSYVHRLRGQLDVESMKAAAKHLVGRHHFDSFMTAGSGVQTTDRTISKLEIKENGGIPKQITITITADGFLYNMVRIITAVLIKVGQGKLTPDDVLRILKARDRSLAPWVAPACGLYLESVEYGN
ncbi:MAG: tRNA pseudouridine(38-40) synthase TruA [Firmicutes bacterium]|nr:tRNA pseudouridine(38-40) synthase TruA [Bacillota bacterium]